MNIIDIHALVKVYETGHRALDGLTLRVHSGSIFGFIGLNGAGKTTTIRILAGLLPKEGGTIRVFGKEIGEQSNDYKRDVGFVLDEPLYFEWMSVKEYLRFVGTMFELPPRDIGRRTAELMEFFDLAPRQDDPVGILSTGMKKKVSLAAAIIHKPKLIVLDEPLEGIDALAASSIKETLTMMASKGTTIFITSHVLDTVEKFCIEVAVIHEGRILLQCATDEIRRKTKGKLKTETYASLEELFVDLVSDKVRKKHLSYV